VNPASGVFEGQRPRIEAMSFQEPRIDSALVQNAVADPRANLLGQDLILHRLRNWFDRRGVLRGQGQRLSRHYYDVHRILQSELGSGRIADRGLAADCVAHARMFFTSRTLVLFAQFLEHFPCR
jgi:hypothetical protein